MGMHPVIRAFRDRCAAHGFPWREGESVLSQNPKLLFNISGGVVFEPVIASGQRPETCRVASCQTCLRTDGWDRVGVSGRHHLAFDMLGHFSLYEGDERVTKEVMIRTAWRFLVDDLALPVDRLSVTVHPADHVAQEVWQGVGAPAIIPQPGNTHEDPTGTKSGLRTEIQWQPMSPVGRALPPVELWNLVFTQFEGSDPFVRPLDRIAADSGMSLDRAVTAHEDRPDDYQNSLWVEVIAALRRAALSSGETQTRRLADLGRGAVTLIAAGLRPGHRGAAYVLRKIIREAALTCREVGLAWDRFSAIVGEHWLDPARHPSAAAVIVDETLRGEWGRFRRCLERGERICDDMLRERDGELSPEDLAHLHATFGYPPRLARRRQAAWRGEPND